MLPEDHEIRQSILSSVTNFMEKVFVIKDIDAYKSLISNEYLENYYIDEINTATGNVRITLSFSMSYYYQMMSAILGLRNSWRI